MVADARLTTLQADIHAAIARHGLTKTDLDRAHVRNRRAFSVQVQDRTSDTFKHLNASLKNLKNAFQAGADQAAKVNWTPPKSKLDTVTPETEALWADSDPHHRLIRETHRGLIRLEKKLDEYALEDERRYRALESYLVGIRRWTMAFGNAITWIATGIMLVLLLGGCQTTQGTAVSGQNVFYPYDPTLTSHQEALGWRN